MKEVKVQYKFAETGEYKEIWKVVDKKAYVAREYAHGGVWCRVSDAPDGFCELDSPVSDGIIFVVCGSDGKELFRSSNGDGSSQFPSFEQACQNAWKAIAGNYPEVRSWDRRWWLSNYLTDEIREQLKNEFSVDGNFTDVWTDLVQDEVLNRFQWLDWDCAVHRTLKKSRYAKTAYWYEYWVGTEKPEDGCCKQGYYAGWGSKNVETEMALKHANGYLAVQVCVEGFDYTFMDKDYNLIDGGRLEAPELLVYEAAARLLHMQGWDGRRALTDYEETMEFLARSEEARIQAKIAAPEEKDI